MYMRVVNIVVNNYMCITVCWLEGQSGFAYSIQYRYTHFALLSFMIFFRVFNSSSVLGWFGFFCSCPTLSIPVYYIRNIPKAAST